MAHKLKLALPLIICLAAITPATASAKTPAKCVVPKLTGLTLTKAKKAIKSHHCLTGKITGTHAGVVYTQTPKAGKRKKHGTKVKIGLETKAKLAAASTKYSTVDPTFTQNPSDPLQVTYSFSATAIENVGSETINLGSEDELPAGILNFFEGGSLVCAINVGGAATGGTCSATYPDTGAYSVTTQYIPNGEAAVTETDTETIEPFATTTTLATAIGAPQGTENYFFVGVAWNILDPSGDLVSAATTVAPTFTIIDVSTGQTVGSWAGYTGQTSCAIATIGNGNGTIAFDGNTCDDGNPTDLSPADHYEMTVTFPGIIGYSSSTSAAAVI